MKRVPELDALRGIAAAAIVLYHDNMALFHVLSFFVDLFFVLSGYLITNIIIHEHREPHFLRDFYLKRVFRIWPVYFLTMAGVLLANRFAGAYFSCQGMAYHILFLQNLPIYWGGDPPPFIPCFNVSWSVAMEEQYYLIWPLLLLGLRPRSVPALAGWFFAANVAARMILKEWPPVLFTRGDGLAFGCLLAWLMSRADGGRLAIRMASVAGAIGAIYVAAFLCENIRSGAPHWHTTDYPGFGLLWFSLIGISARYSGHWALAPLRLKPLVWCGTVSYAMYMFHEPIFNYAPATLIRLGVHSPAAIFTIKWLLIAILPALSWICLERPMMRLRRRLLDPPRPETGTANAAGFPQSRRNH